ELGHRMAKIDRGGPVNAHRKIFKLVCRRQCSVITQLCSGHVGLNTYLHRIQAVNSPLC
ncbi:hypothetical protein BS47DRAFT_1279156, partial [Hydnum rufescens UP504]